MFEWPEIASDARYGPDQNESIRDIHNVVIEQSKAVLDLMESNPDDFALQIMAAGRLMRAAMSVNNGLVMLTQAFRDESDTKALDEALEEADATVRAVYIMHRRDVDDELKELLS